MRNVMTPGWNPFNSLTSFRRDMDELFNRFFGDWERESPSWGPMRVGYAPHIESYVEGNMLYVKVDLPGVDPKEVELAVEGNQLIISGERKAEQERKENDYLYQEVQYGGFACTVMLPEGVQADNIHATYHSGVLEVTIPLPNSMIAKKVPIQIEGETLRQIAA